MPPYKPNPNLREEGDDLPNPVKPIPLGKRDDLIAGHGKGIPQPPLGEDGYEPVGGLRYNDDKIRFDLLPHDAIEALAQHYTIGAKKYADRNWEKGFKWTICGASLMRHLFLWLAGEDYDVGPNGEWGEYPDQPDIHMRWTGSLHMTCVLWNAAALTTFALRQSGADDRVKTRPSPKPIVR
jgi:hypothetical protein